jgi:hypothetical protein
MLRTASSLPHTGLLTLDSDPARCQTEPPACYRASWQLPGPDFHRQATTSLRTRRNTMALRHGATSCSAGRTKDQGWTTYKFAYCLSELISALRRYHLSLRSAREVISLMGTRIASVASGDEG